MSFCRASRSDDTTFVLDTREITSAFDETRKEWKDSLSHAECPSVKLRDHQTRPGVGGIECHRDVVARIRWENTSLCVQVNDSHSQRHGKAGTAGHTHKGRSLLLTLIIQMLQMIFVKIKRLTPKILPPPMKWLVYALSCAKGNYQFSNQQKSLLQFVFSNVFCSRNNLKCCRFQQLLT